MRRHVTAATLLLLAAPAIAQQPKPKPTPAPAVAPSVAAPALTRASSRFLLEITGGLGITGVDVNKWAGMSANDWGTMNYYGAGRLFFPSRSSVRFGIEAGYQYHFWYNYYPGGVSWVYQYDVTAEHVAGLARYTFSPRFSGDLGVGLNFLSNEGGTGVGVIAGLAYHVPFGKSMDGFVGLRTNQIFTDPSLSTAVVNLGVGIPL